MTGMATNSGMTEVWGILMTSSKQDYSIWYWTYLTVKRSQGRYLANIRINAVDRLLRTLNSTLVQQHAAQDRIQTSFRKA